MKVKINSLRLDSTVKLFVLSGASIGLPLGLLLFLVSFVSDSVTFSFGGQAYTGIAAGIGNLFALPIGFSISAAILSLLAHIPIKIILKLQKGQVIEGDIEIGEADRINDRK